MALTGYIWSFAGNLSSATKTLLSWQLFAAATKWIRLLSQTPCFQLQLTCTRWEALPAETTSTQVSSVYCAHCCWPAWPAQIALSGAKAFVGNRSRASWLFNDFFYHFCWIDGTSMCRLRLWTKPPKDNFHHLLCWLEATKFSSQKILEAKCL